MALKRQLYRYLKEWKTAQNRKPLILRGARQVGKTTLVEDFAKTYAHSILINLEKEKDIFHFEQHNDVKTITESLFLAHKIPLDNLSKTLLFIDEIQESTKAIQLLRYFYEDQPQLHVIAAGSLLEFAMRKVKSFPVGRIEYLYLHPLNFAEFLEAINHPQALEHLKTIPLKPVAHKLLLDLFNRYAIIGGMPEVVKTYSQNKEMVTALPKIYESIWATYKDDVEKYATNEMGRKVIKYLMDTAPLYLDQRIKFQNFGNSTYRSREVGEAFRNLDDAKILRIIYPSTSIETPIKPSINKSPRMQFLDTGLVNHTLGIQADLLGLKELSNAYRGALIPHLITQEMLSLNTINDKKPVFWVREKKQASSEVDLLYSYKNKVIPIEMKSGSAGKLRSLHQFIERTNHPYAIRLYAGVFSIENHKTPSGTPFLLMNMPYYLGTKIPEYVEYFAENFRL